MKKMMFLRIGQKAKMVFIALILISTFFAFSYSKPTIPLETPININITQIDTAKLDYYNIYRFEYKMKLAQFLAAKKDTVLEVGPATVSLCRVIQLHGGDLNIRSNRATWGEFYINHGDSNEIHFSFNPESEFPTLRLCSAK